MKCSHNYKVFYKFECDPDKFLLFVFFCSYNGFHLRIDYNMKATSKFKIIRSSRVLLCQYNVKDFFHLSLFFFKYEMCLTFYSFHWSYSWTMPCLIFQTTPCCPAKLLSQSRCWMSMSFLQNLPLCMRRLFVKMQK